jgi:hypothetical protein
MDFFGDYSSSDSGGGTDNSSLYGGILNAVTQLGTAAIISSNPPPIQQSYPYRPPLSTQGIFTGSGVGGVGTGSSGLFWLFAIAVAVVGFFALRK